MRRWRCNGRVVGLSLARDRTRLLLSVRPFRAPHSHGGGGGGGATTPHPAHAHAHAHAAHPPPQPVSRPAASPPSPGGPGPGPGSAGPLSSARRLWADAPEGAHTLADPRSDDPADPADPAAAGGEAGAGGSSSEAGGAGDSEGSDGAVDSDVELQVRGRRGRRGRLGLVISSGGCAGREATGEATGTLERRRPVASFTELCVSPDPPDDAAMPFLLIPMHPTGHTDIHFRSSICLRGARRGRAAARRPLLAIAKPMTPVCAMSARVRARIGGKHYYHRRRGSWR